jgi:hypothetical protein
VLRGFKEKMNILHTKWRKGNWMGKFLHENCLIQNDIEERDRSDGKTRKKK